MGDNGPILVTGATGQQGGAVARALIAKGQKVRVMTRHPEKAAALAKAGADVVQGDLTNQTCFATGVAWCKRRVCHVDSV